MMLSPKEKRLEALKMAFVLPSVSKYLVISAGSITSPKSKRAGAGLDAEVMSATKGDITFNTSFDATSLSDAFNQAPLVNSGSASAFLKYTKLEGFDGPQSMNSVWESNTIGGGVISLGTSGSRSINVFQPSPMSLEDSIKRAQLFLV